MRQRGWKVEEVFPADCHVVGGGCGLREAKRGDRPDAGCGQGIRWAGGVTNTRPHQTCGLCPRFWCFFFSPKSKGSPLKSSSQICVLGSVDRLEEGGPGQRKEQEQLGGGFCDSNKISPKVMRIRQTPGWLEES